MTRFNQLVVRWPKLTLLLGLLITICLGDKARDFRIDSSVENLYNQNDPNKEYYENIRARFGSDDMDVIGVVADNVYTTATLQKIKRITDEVEKVDGVERAQSLTNVPDPVADLANPPALVAQIPTDQAALAALRRKVEDVPIYLNVVSRDGKGAAILIFFKIKSPKMNLCRKGATSASSRSSLTSADPNSCTSLARSTYRSTLSG